MQFHPVANIFPMMSAEEFAALKADIQQNGLREPIWLHDDQIIDGRNRYNACEQLGVKPQFRPWNGKDEEELLWFVVSLNKERRHLNSSQLATLGEEIKDYLAKIAKQKQLTGKSENGTGGRPVKSYTSGYKEDTKSNLEEEIPQGYQRQPQVREQVAKQLGTNPRYVSDAATLKVQAPDLYKEVHHGKMRIPEAKREMKSRQSAEVRTRAAAEIKQTNSNIIVGDFWANADKVPDNSLSLIFTDPPYDKKAEATFPHLAEFAARKLAPGGSILFYLGHLQLPAAFKAFEVKLRYWWTCACVHGGGRDLMNYYGVRVGWKPMLWFVKESRFDIQNIVSDTISGATEKQHHDWQQSEEEARYWIEQLCPADGIVCDPFLGGGTTAAAAKKLNRKWIAFEIDPETARIASGRLEKENDSKV